MSKILAAIIAGLSIGAAGSWYVLSERLAGAETKPSQLRRDLLDVPKMTTAAAEQHRGTRYNELHTIEQILALPTPFAQSEALFLLAGRSHSAPVQALIFEANRIADPGTRETTLNILFFRLAELDPESALALSRTDFFAGEKTVERQIWRAWAKLDFDAAIAGALAQPTPPARNSAAQALYAAFGDMGNEVTDRIEAALAIGPDRATRARFLYRIADRSATEAIDYINAMQAGRERSEFVSWLAYYLAQKDASVAASYADRIEGLTQRSNYERIVERHYARENPAIILDRLLSSGSSGLSRSELHSAMQAVASSDLDLALSYFERIDSAADRRAVGSAIVAEYARHDIDAALAWVNDNESDNFPTLQAALLQTIAETDPKRALELALGGENTTYRSMLVGNLLSIVVRTDPQQGIAYLEQISDPRLRNEATEQLVTQWIRRDANAAVEWILSQNKQSGSEILEQAASRIINGDVDAAIRLLPGVAEEQTHSWRYQIAQRLATQRSPAAAFNFINQFEGQENFDSLRSAVIAGLARSDPSEARMLADQLPDGTAKDSAYVAIVNQHASSNPAEAAAWLASIANEQQRSSAAGMVINRWHAEDAVAAERWVTRLASGPMRDSAIMMLASRWGSITDAQQSLIDNIEDADIRAQAISNRIMTVMRRDPQRARRMLQEADIPNLQRQRIESYISRMTGHL